LLFSDCSCWPASIWRWL